MNMIGKNIAKATLALALAAGGTALYAQDSGPTPPESDMPAPAEPAPQTDPAAPAPAPAPGEHVDADGDGVDDVTGQPIPQDEGAPAPDPQ